MFKIRKIEIQGFKAFSGQHEFTFPKTPGLYLLTGTNKRRPRMGPNAVGKSTLLDAICWGLYGVTPRRVRAGNVVTWGQKYARVSVTLRVAGNPITVTRTQAPNSLSLTEGVKGRPVDQIAVNKALRLNVDGFLSSVMNAQFGESFLMLTPTAKLNLFSDILELDVWLEHSANATKIEKELADDLGKIQLRLTEVQASIKILADDIKRLEELAPEWTEVNNKAIKEKRKLIEKAEVRLAQIDEELSTEFGQAKADDLHKILDGLNQSIGRLESELAMATSRKRGIKQMLENLPKAGATCPECKQKLDPKHLRVEMRRLEGELGTSMTEMDEIQSNLDVKRQRKQEIFREIGKIKHWSADIDALEREKSTLITAHGHGQQELRNLKAKENPYTKLGEEKKSNWRKQRLLLVQLQESLNSINQKHAAVAPWVAGFKKIRLFIIENTLKQLEIEVNNNLANLGMPEWRISFDVERENKSGGMTQGFSVFVHSPDHKEPVPFEAWSGGETQRLCLAADFGLADLIMERAGLTGGIEFYDEPSQHLSSEGLQDLAETLAQRAEDQNKKIFLVDHHVIDFGGFAGTIRVVKDSEGAHISLD